MTTLPLSKLHATGNDFLVLVDLEARFGSPGRPRLAPRLRAALCDRRRGVGADGLIRLIAGADGADCVMELANADGGLAEISGNGLRCLAFVADGLGLARGDDLVVDTPVGRRLLTLRRRRVDGTVVGATAEMGEVTFLAEEIPFLGSDPAGLTAEVDGASYSGDAAGCGNPHLVLFVADPDAVPLDRHGVVLEHDRRFPRRTNVEVVAPMGSSGPGATTRDDGPAPGPPRDGLRMRVWERGVGETASCGSGACAAAAAAWRRGLVGHDVLVSVPGGNLTVGIDPSIDGRERPERVAVRLGGPVAHVFDVDVDLDRLAETIEPVGDWL